MAKYLVILATLISFSGCSHSGDDVIWAIEKCTNLGGIERLFPQNVHCVDGAVYAFPTN